MAVLTRFLLHLKLRVAKEKDLGFYLWKNEGEDKAGEDRMKNRFEERFLFEWLSPKKHAIFIFVLKNHYYNPLKY